MAQHIEYREVLIKKSDLAVGMHVVKLDRPWEETNFLLQGFVIKSQEEIYELQTQCESVYVQVRVEEVDTFKRGILEKRKNRATSKESSGRVGYDKPFTQKRINYINQVSFEDALEHSTITFDSARNLAKNIMDGVRMGHSIDMNHCREIVEEVVLSVLANPDALRLLSQIKHKDNYTAEHSMNVCVLAATFARFLGLEDFEIKNIALGGLLHDVGKARIPLEVLNKPGRFNANEAKVMSNHARFGRDILMSLPQNNRSAVDIAHSHHERIDGRGYPRNLAAHQIPYYAKIVCIVDAYDAMTSRRVYGDPKTSYDALTIIKDCSGTQFDKDLSDQFVKCIGIFPVGCIIELTSGEAGIVLNSDEGKRLKPKVLIVRNADKKILKPEKIVNLNTKSGAHYQILRELPNGSYGIKIEDFIKKGLKLK